MASNSTLIFTDGASKGNPGSGGWGAVISYRERIIEIGGSEKRTTNNRMELTAAIKGLMFLSTLNPKPSTLTLYSDSSYVVNGITKWVSGWKQKGWITTQKEGVLNRDLWEQLDSFSSQFSIKWHRIIGHADTPGNSRADEIASAFGEGENPRLFDGPKDAYRLDLLSIGARHRSDFSGMPTKSGKNGKAYSYVSLVDDVVQTHKTWDECKKRVEGKPHVRFRKTLTSGEEQEIIAEFQK